jgi:hypothetical protein
MKCFQMFGTNIRTNSVISLFATDTLWRPEGLKENLSWWSSNKVQIQFKLELVQMFPAPYLTQIYSRLLHI